MMRRLNWTCWLLLAAAALAGPTTQAAQWDAPQAEAPETKDRLGQESMEQLVERPIWLIRHQGLAKGQEAFDALLAETIRKHGKGSVKEADLLMAFAVQLYSLDIGRGEDELKRAALSYVERSIPAYRAAFGARHAEVAVALNSYADVALGLHDKQLLPGAIAALEEALAIRAEKLGANNAETKATVTYLERARERQSARPDEATLDVALAETVSATASLDTAELVTGDDDRFWKPVGSYFPMTDEFLGDLDRLEPGLDAPKRALAAKYGLSVKALDEGMSLLRDMQRNGERGRRDGLRARTLAWIRLSNRAPIALALAAAILDEITDGDCRPADVDLLMSGSRHPDADLWTIVTNCTSRDSLAAAIGRPTAARPALLYLSMNWTHGEPATEIAATDMLLRPEFVAAIGPERDRIHAEIARYKLSRLLDVGLWNEAITFADSLDPTILRLALKHEKGPIETVIGGLPFKEQYFSEPPAEDYAAALALAGRPADARSVLDAIAPRARLKEIRSCLDRRGDDCGVGVRGIPLGALVVDQLLEDPSADPYVLIESAPASSTSWSGAVTEVLCRLQTRPDEAKDCADMRAAVIRERAPQIRDGAFWAAIRHAGGPALESARSRYAAVLPAAAAEPEKADWSRASVEPAPAPFRELPITPQLLAQAPRPAAVSAATAALPTGYDLVRREQSGKRVVAVSLSTRFDPNGEVSGGGYWIHLSDDGGKTWGAPFYTGLAEHFPYVVPKASRVPMLAGDRIRLEVEEALIDTATISYPPVGLHVRRKRSGIYLDIPIADLTKDSDGDGLTDIAARHLLLDRNSSSATPFIVGRDRGCAAPGPETMARLEILKKLFQVEARAIIEAPDKTTLFGGWRRSEPGSDRPIFLRGNPDDWRCVAVDRPMIVYSEADQERLRKFSPDFQLIELPPIRWNRARTRGFVNWSMGWTGGTYRLIREGDGWKLESISEWIT